jgi:hypothetical protein
MKTLQPHSGKAQQTAVGFVIAIEFQDTPARHMRARIIYLYLAALLMLHAMLHGEKNPRQSSNRLEQ